LKASCWRQPRITRTSKQAKRSSNSVAQLEESVEDCARSRNSLLLKKQALEVKLGEVSGDRSDLERKLKEVTANHAELQTKFNEAATIRSALNAKLEEAASRQSELEQQDSEIRDELQTAQSQPVQPATAPAVHRATARAFPQFFRRRPLGGKWAESKKLLDE